MILFYQNAQQFSNHKYLFNLLKLASKLTINVYYKDGPVEFFETFPFYI